MKYLVVGKVTSDQVDRLCLEAEKRGHTLDNCSSYDLVTKTKIGSFEPTVSGIDLTSYDLIYLLTVGKRNWEWYVACDFLNKEKGVEVVEGKMIDPGYKVYLTSTSELYKQVKENIPFPKTTVVISSNNLNEVLKHFEFPVVIKNSYQQRGLGVSLAKTEKDVKRIIEGDNKSNSFMIREFIPNDGDIRVFTVGLKAIGAMKRIPPKNDFRSNISRGGRGEKYDLEKNPEVKELAESMARINQTEIAGVDVMINKKTGKLYILEINRGPQFRGLEKFTKINVAKELIKYFEEKVSKN